ncbi:MAG TPA: AraC family transcriptional regulator [Dinghuibacter sp.]|jgi:AraC-like DNA-binding protein|uniref:AraC family transcriptional regulator n=1 Tax=Dinghuibacter sp. TaxID=2024697 RepID=UPI002CBAA98F|nr:AraC family transcriptional regulator [Dinghuibacter sp.]HTJ12381.1 AraC family transcriptional regulator [Dinghuibacter sp.]
MEAAYPKMYLYRRLVQAKLFIDAHYAEAIDLDLIADEAAFSKFHFLKLFKSAYGRTPHQYLIHVRLQKALELLDGDLAVSEVCYAVGFESVGSFSLLFKRVHGCTPTACLAGRRAFRTAATTAPLQFVPACFATRNGWLAENI